MLWNSCCTYITLLARVCQDDREQLVPAAAHWCDRLLFAPFVLVSASTPRACLPCAQSAACLVPASHVPSLQRASCLLPICPVCSVPRACLVPVPSLQLPVALLCCLQESLDSPLVSHHPNRTLSHNDGARGWFRNAPNVCHDREPSWERSRGQSLDR